jgi:DNA-binding XRE family transcriptional regulator
LRLRQGDHPRRGGRPSAAGLVERGRLHPSGNVGGVATYESASFQALPDQRPLPGRLMSALSELDSVRPGTPLRSGGMDNVIPLRSPKAPDPEPLWREALGDQLRAERRARGERILDVAERAGVSPQYLSELERGRKDPSSEILSAVSGALGLSVLDLTRRAGQRLASGIARSPVCLAA